MLVDGDGVGCIIVFGENVEVYCSRFEGWCGCCIFLVRLVGIESKGVVWGCKVL